MKDPLDETLNLKCGCLMKKDGKVFVIKPCSPSCSNYKWVMNETAQRGNAVMFIPIKELIK